MRSREHRLIDSAYTSTMLNLNTCSDDSFFTKVAQTGFLFLLVI